MGFNGVKDFFGYVALEHVGKFRNNGSRNQSYPICLGLETRVWFIRKIENDEIEVFCLKLVLRAVQAIGSFQCKTNDGGARFPRVACRR